MVVLGAGGRTGRARSAQAGRWELGHTGAGALGAQGKLARGARAVGSHSGGRASTAREAQAAGSVRQRGRARQCAAGRVAGLALGNALGALGPFSIHFDSFFFMSHQMNTVHCKIKFFRKKINNIY